MLMFVIKHKPSEREEEGRQLGSINGGVLLTSRSNIPASAERGLGGVLAQCCVRGFLQPIENGVPVPHVSVSERRIAQVRT